MWKSKDINFITYLKILVLGRINDNDSTLQLNMENHLVGDLNKLGYNAFSALQKYGPDTFKNSSLKAINEKCRNSDFDLVITIVLLKKETGVKYVPSSFYQSSTGLYYYNYNGFDIGLPNVIYYPGHYINYADYLWINSVYDVGSGKLGYSSQIHSDN